MAMQATVMQAVPHLRMYRCRSRGAWAPGAPRCSNGYITSCKQRHDQWASPLIFGL